MGTCPLADIDNVYIVRLSKTKKTINSSSIIYFRYRLPCSSKASESFQLMSLTLIRRIKVCAKYDFPCRLGLLSLTFWIERNEILINKLRN